MNHMKRWIGLGIGLLIASCSTSTPKSPLSTSASPGEPAPNEQPSFVLDNYGPAPELENEVWLNTDQPLRLANLRGQVVLLDMWTFG
jgi:hypothetical protein